MGDDVVVKLQWPHPECEHEAAALAAWGGGSAVRLLDHDPARHALLLERCIPGVHLAAAASAGSVDPLGVFADILPRLWNPAGPPFRHLADEAQAWADGLERRWEGAGRPCERRLIDAAARLLAELIPGIGAPVLVHQDLHGDNVLAASRLPWLVIDPKPLAGEREPSIAPVVRSFELGHSRAAVRYRLERLCAQLGLDRERARGWAIAQAVAWSFDPDSPYGGRHHDTVRWLLDD